MKFNSLPELTPEQITRFWKGFKRNSKTGCLEYQGFLNPSGYAQVKISGRQYYIHRLAWFLHYDEDPSDLLVCHTCDVRHCAEKTHLFKGTHSDNTVDSVKKDRWAASGDRHWARKNPERVEELKAAGAYEPQRQYLQKYNQNHPNTKLTEVTVKELKERAANGESNRALAEAYGITHSNVSAILLGKSWSHVSGAVRKKDTRFRSKLTPAVVREVRRRAADGETAWKLGKEFGVTPSSIQKIIDRVSWKHIE